jgi:hypothetical protein
MMGFKTFSSQAYRMALVTSTALIAAVMVAPAAARADITVTNATAATQTLGAGETLTVTNTGTVSADPSVLVDGVAATAINNGGTLNGGGGTAIFVRSGGDLTTGIDNAGTVKGNLTGLSVSSASISGNITNEAGGTIASPSDTGIYLSHSSVVGGSLNNLGLISGASVGMLLTNNTTDIQGGLQNSGTIAGGTAGLWLNSDADISGGIANAGGGFITGGREGISLTGTVMTGAIVNQAGGTITGGTRGIAVKSGSDITGGIDNSGRIIGGVSSDDGGIDILDHSNVSGGIVNRATGTIESNNDTAFAIYNGSTMTGLIDNEGLIHGLGSAAVYIGNYGGSASSAAGGLDNSGRIIGVSTGIILHKGDIGGGGLVNSGTISGGNVAGVLLQSGGNISGGLDNSGVIEGKIGVRVSAGGSKISGGITNMSGGTIEGTGGKAIVLTGLGGLSPITINGGRIIGDVTDNATANGFSPVTIGGNFSTEGNFTVSSVKVNAGQTLEISSGDVFTVNHMEASGAGSGITFMVTSDGAGGFGELKVNGAGQGIDLTNITIGVDVAASPTLADGDALLVADGVANVTGGPGATPLAVIDNSAAWDFQLVDGTYGALGGDATQLYLLVTSGGCGDVTLNGAAALTQNMCAGETLTVTSTGKLTAAPAVNVDGVAAKQVDNSGTLDGGAQSAIVVQGAGGDLTTGIVNQAGGVIASEGADGIHIVSGADVTGSIQNMGTISAHSTGVYVRSVALAGGIVNSGVIQGGASAIVVRGTGGDLTAGIVNQAGGVIAGTGVDGIHIVSGAAVTGAIQNMGTVSAHSTGVYVRSASLAGDISNSGVIKGGDNGVYAVNATLGGGIANSGTGTISGTGTAGIDLYGTAMTGAVTNAAGGVISGGSHGVFVRSHSDIQGGIDNSGTIAGGITAGYGGIDIAYGSDVSGGIVNRAGGVVSSGLDAGINVVSSDMTGLIRNMGTISGASTGIFSGNGNADISGGIDNSGTIMGGTQAGIWVYDGGDVSGGLTNSGLVRGVTAAGIWVYNSGDISGGVVNSGTIMGGSKAGIWVYNNSDISGGVANTGLVSGGADPGIWIFNTGADISGGVDNSGVIKGDTGIYASSGATGISGSLSNAATGTISGASYGVFLRSGAKIQGGIDNSGTIAGGTRGGIWVQDAGSDIGTGITNSGTISSGRFAAINIHSGATLTGQIINQGLIEGMNATSATGIFVGYNNADIMGGIVNNGIVRSLGSAIQSYDSGDISGGVVNNAAGLVSGVTVGVAVYYGADISGGIDNKGVIKSGNIGIGVKTGDISGLVENEAGGTISGGIAAVGLSNGDISGGIENAGVITGAKGVLVQSASRISGGIVNLAGGTIEGTGGTAIGLQGLSAATPLTIDGGRIIGDVTDDAPANGFSPVTIGGDFTTEGNFTVSSLHVTSGNKLEIASGNTVTVDHMLASGGGNIAFMVTSDAAGGYGQLVVNGAGQAVNVTGATISVDIAASPTLADGDALLIADGVAAVTGGPGATPQTVTDNSGAWDFQLVDGTYGALGGDATQLYLLVSAVTGGPGGGFTPITPGNAAAETTLNGLGGAGGPELSQIVANLGAATTQAEYNDILSSVQPDVSGASFNASLNVLDQSLDLVSDWLDGISGKWESTGLSSGNAPGNDLQGWAQVFGNYASQQTRSNIAGYDAHTAGFAMGVDTGDRYENGKVGLAVSYARTATSSGNANRSQNDIDSYQVTAYGELKLSEHSFVRGMAAYVRGNTDTARYDVGGTPGLTARGSFASNQYTARVIAGHGYMFGHEGTFTPHLLADWTHYAAQDYTETGAGGASLAVSQKAVDMAELGLGMDVDWHFQQESGAVFSPQLRAGYRYDLIGDRLETTAGFAGGGAAFTSPGPVPARSRFNLGAQLGWQSPASWSAILGYDFDYRDGYYAHSGVFKVTDKF